LAEKSISLTESAVKKYSLEYIKIFFDGCNVKNYFLIKLKFIHKSLLKVNILKLKISKEFLCKVFLKSAILEIIADF
jgi:hypothetical protein